MNIEEANCVLLTVVVVVAFYLCAPSGVRAARIDVASFLVLVT